MSLFYAPFLTKEDEHVPEHVVPVHEMFVLSRDVRELYGEEVANKLRKDSYWNVLRLLKKYGGNDFETFWNTHIYEITRLELNEFAKFDKLRPLCYCVKAYTKIITFGGNKRKAISFGIEKKDLNQYVIEKRKAEKAGEQFVFSLSNPQRIESHLEIEGIDFGITEMKLSDKAKVRIIKNANYFRFKHWYELNQLSAREAINMAISQLVENNMHRDIKAIEDYDTQTVFDKYNFDYNQEQSSVIKTSSISVSGDLVNNIKQAIERYNADPVNNGKQLNYKAFILTAIENHLQSMPIKYCDPQLWQRQIDEYNKLTALRKQKLAKKKVGESGGNKRQRKKPKPSE